MLPPLQYTVVRYSPTATLLEYWRLVGTDRALETFDQIRAELQPGESVTLHGTDDQIIRAATDRQPPPREHISTWHTRMFY